MGTLHDFKDYPYNDKNMRYFCLFLNDFHPPAGMGGILTYFVESELDHCWSKTAERGKWESKSQKDRWSSRWKNADRQEIKSEWRSKCKPATSGINDTGYGNADIRFAGIKMTAAWAAECDRSAGRGFYSSWSVPPWIPESRTNNDFRQQMDISKKRLKLSGSRK